MKGEAIANTPGVFRAMEKAVQSADLLGFDTETTGLEHDRRLVGYSMATRDNSWYVPIAHDPDRADAGGNMERAPALEFMGSVLNDPSKIVVAHNMKFDAHTARNAGVDPFTMTTFSDKRRCTLIMAWIVDPARALGLKPLVWNLFQHKMSTYEDTFGYERPNRVAISKVAPYAADDALWLPKLHDRLYADIEKMGEETVKVFLNLECLTVFMLEEMENIGAPVDGAYLRSLSKALASEAESAHRTLASVVGFPKAETKIGSTQWLSKTFIDELKWWPPLGERGKPSKTGKPGGYSTDKENMAIWAGGAKPGTTKAGADAAKAIMRWRKVAKLESTYTGTLADKADACGRIHASFNHNGTVTGRFSSSEPNLQNIPRDDAREEDEGGLPSIRKAFIARPGYVYVDVDYSQIELRLMAHFSQDPLLLKVYQEDGDIHQLTADQCGCSRQHAKAINFGLIYGMGWSKLAGSIHVSEREAKKYWTEYFKAYKGVALYQERVKSAAAKQGFVTTLLGRRRYLPGIKSDDHAIRGSAERKSVNTKIQGSAADLLKVGMRNIRRQFIAEGLFNESAFMLTQVHDELGFEVREDVVDKTCRIIKTELEGAVKLRVPLVAAIGVGANWSEAK